MTTGSYVDDFRSVGPYGVKIGSYRSQTWSGVDRVMKPVEPVNLRRVYYSPEHLGAIRMVTPLSRDSRRDYNGDLIIPFDIPLAPYGNRRPKRDSKQNDWHPFQKSGESSFSGLVNEYNPSGVYTGTYPVTSVADSSWHSITPVLLDGNDTIKAQNRVFAKMKGSDFNASIFLAEGHQTLNLIAGTAIKLAKSIHHLRRGDVSGAARSLVAGTDRRPLRHPPGTWKGVRQATVKELGSAWLELQYGWLPLLSDVHDGAEALAHQITPPFSTSVKTVIRKKHEFNPGKGYGSSAMRVEELFLEFIATEKPSLPAVLGLTNPLSVAWELVPFSFVADWFIPIGDYLAARGAASSLVGSYRMSRKLSSFLSYSPGFNGYATSVWNGPPSWGKAFIFERYPASSALRPPLPSYKPLEKALSVKHCLNAVALLATSFSNPEKFSR